MAKNEKIQIGANQSWFKGALLPQLSLGTDGKRPTFQIFNPSWSNSPFSSSQVWILHSDPLYPPDRCTKGRRYCVCEEHIAKIPDRKHKTRRKRKENRSSARSQRRLLMRRVYFREVDIALLRVSAGTLCLQFFSKSRVLFLALRLRVRACLCFK